MKFFFYGTKTILDRSDQWQLPFTNIIITLVSDRFVPFHPVSMSLSLSLLLFPMCLYGINLLSSISLQFLPFVMCVCVCVCVGWGDTNNFIRMNIWLIDLREKKNFFSTIDFEYYLRSFFPLFCRTNSFDLRSVCLNAFEIRNRRLSSRGD